MNPRLSLLLFTILVGLNTACKSFGPNTVPRDRFQYSASIADSWKRQTLLNIVKLRYLDPPIFVDVGQIVAGYSLETGGSIGGELSSDVDTLFLGGNIKYTDRPTITYTPLTGNRFLRGLMTPLMPESVFFTIQSGWPADGVLLASVASINGLKNQEVSLDGVTHADPDFLRVLALMRDIQLSGAVGLHVIQDAQKNETTLLTFRMAGISDETLEKISELRRILRLDPEAAEFKLVFGTHPSNDRELAVLTRSMLHLMQTMASHVEVPAQDLAETRAAPGVESALPDSNTLRLVRIQSSEKPPDDAFVTIPYRGHWFYIDDRDLVTKRVFAFMMMLFTLTDTGDKEPLPLITIPAQ